MEWQTHVLVVALGHPITEPSGRCYMAAGPRVPRSVQGTGLGTVIVVLSRHKARS